jgi:inorganic pyrophosphatase
MSFKHIPLGEKAPEIINVVIEITRESRNKYEYDEELDVIRLDRVVHTPMFYPTDYGFVPETRSDDGDHLDALVLITQPTFPGCVLKARPVGMLDLSDEAGQDWKIIAVAEDDPYYDKISDISDVNEHLKKEIKHFFQRYKDLEKNKETHVKNWHSKKETYDIIAQAHKKYNK